MTTEVTGKPGTERMHTSPSAERWAFTTSAEPPTLTEQSIFEGDLARLGIDSGIWDVFRTVLSTGTPASRPLALRAYEDDELIGLAFFYECRKTGECSFDPPISIAFDMPGMPMFI